VRPQRRPSRAGGTLSTTAIAAGERHKMKKLLVVLILAAATTAQGWCQSRGSLNEQKTCSESAKRMADKWRVDARKLVNKNAEVYEFNHFQNGRCLVAVTQYVPRDSKMVRIIDVFENNALGDYLEMNDADEPTGIKISVCVVDHTNCSTLSEFQKLMQQKFGLTASD
jgi:hypothetical protein